MKIIKASAYLLNPETYEAGKSMLRNIEFAARLSHRSEEQTGLNTERFIESVVMGHGDWSVTEHSQAAVLFHVDRGITHELVRHRLFSFTQESTRFVNYNKVYPAGHPKAGQYVTPASFIYPLPGVECAHCLAGHEAVAVEQQVPFVWVHNILLSDSEETGPMWSMEPCAYNGNWMTSTANAETFYRELLAPGTTPIYTSGREIRTVQGEISTAYRELTPKWRPQEGRSVLPTSLAAKIMMTGNLRAWRWFMLMRTTKEAHPQMLEVTIPLLAQFKERIPLLFDDIEPMARQIDNAKLAH